MASLILLLGLLALTAWNVTRSDLLTEAQHSYAQGDLTSCLRDALDHLRRRPWSRDAALLAAQCYSRLDFATEAEPFYARAGKLDLNAQQVRAYGLVRGNHRKEAIQAYEQILAHWPENVTALRRLAAVMLTESNFPQLESLAERLIQSPGGASIGYTLRGMVAHNDKNREGAIAAFEHVLQVDPKLEEMPLPQDTFWNYLAEDLIKSGRTEEVGRYLSKVLNETPNTALVNTLGRAYMQQGSLDEAERCFRQAAEWEPESFLPHFNLGKIELQRHRLEAARQQLEAARKLAPRKLDVLHALETAYRLLGLRNEADRVDQEISQIRERARSARNPKDPWPAYAL